MPPAPPESLAAIIFRDSIAGWRDALSLSKSTARNLRYFKVVDAVVLPQTKKVNDPGGMAHNIGVLLGAGDKGSGPAQAGTR